MSELKVEVGPAEVGIGQPLDEFFAQRILGPPAMLSGGGLVSTAADYNRYGYRPGDEPPPPGPTTNSAATGSCCAPRTAAVPWRFSIRGS